MGSGPDRPGASGAAPSQDRDRRSLGEIDYLLGVRDDMRQGALRFRDPETEAFLAEEDDGVPALLGLPRLLASAERVDREEEDDEDLRLLLRGGSSLGGARPKAHVIEENGRPAIAKFPKPSSDQWDVIRWEAVALQLAHLAGIEIPASRLIEVERARRPHRRPFRPGEAIDGCPTSAR